eukprot:SAG31_NODE_41641_length_275_cov_0.590909_1_plen_51_part_10
MLPTPALSEFATSVAGHCFESLITSVCSVDADTATFSLPRREPSTGEKVGW